MRSFGAIALVLAACAAPAQTVSAPLAPPDVVDESHPFVGCWHPKPPLGPLGGVQLVCFERDRYWIFMAKDWDAARVTFVAVSKTEWHLERDSSSDIAIAFVDGGLSFILGNSRGMLERVSADEERAARARIAKLPTIEELCNRARRCIDAAGARLPDEEDDTDRVLASTCIHDVEDTAELLRQRGREVPRECQ
jgi:hypothetical protein